MSENSITITIEKCHRCGCEMMIDRLATSACGDDFAYVLAVCPNCGYKCTVYVVTRPLDEQGVNHV